MIGDVREFSLSKQTNRSKCKEIKTNQINKYICICKASSSSCCGSGGLIDCC